MRHGNDSFARVWPILHCFRICTNHVRDFWRVHCSMSGIIKSPESFFIDFTASSHWSKQSEMRFQFSVCDSTCEKNGFTRETSWFDEFVITDQSLNSIDWYAIRWLLSELNTISHKYRPCVGSHLSIYFQWIRLQRSGAHNTIFTLHFNHYDDYYYYFYWSYSSSFLSFICLFSYRNIFSAAIKRARMCEPPVCMVWHTKKRKTTSITFFKSK